MRFLKDPLLHFLVGGVVLFAVFELSVSDKSSAYGDRSVVVDRPALLKFLQYRMKAFEPSIAAQRLDAMPDAERKQLIDDYIYEEVLYREAIDMGMDGEDYIIRRRLVQKVEFITQGVVEASSTLDDAAIAAYYEANKEDYRVDASITFTHVFFDASKRGFEQAEKMAKEALAELQASGAAFADAPKYGERFLYHLNYVERTREFVASHFAEPMTAAIFGVELGNSWHGPYRSAYGAHLVMVTERRDERTAALADIRERVVEDAASEDSKAKLDEEIAKIIGSYEVRIELEGGK